MFTFSVHMPNLDDDVDLAAEFSVSESQPTVSDVASGSQVVTTTVGASVVSVALASTVTTVDTVSAPVSSVLPPNVTLVGASVASSGASAVYALSGPTPRFAVPGTSTTLNLSAATRFVYAHRSPAGSSSSSGSSLDSSIELYCIICSQKRRPPVFFKDLNALIAHMLLKHKAYCGKGVDLLKNDATDAE